MVCGILVPQPGIEPEPPALEAQSLNHGSTKEVPRISLLRLVESLSDSTDCCSQEPCFPQCIQQEPQFQFGEQLNTNRASWSMEFERTLHTASPFWRVRTHLRTLMESLKKPIYLVYLDVSQIS